jgi:hypothetical protein
MRTCHLGKPQPNHNAIQRNIYTFKIHVAVLRSTTIKESPSYTTHILASFSTIKLHSEKNGRPSSSYSAHPAKLLNCLCWHRGYYCRNHRSLQYCKLEGSRVNARLGRKKTLQCQATTSTRSIVRAILQNSKSHGVSEWLTLYFRDTICDRTQLMNKAKAAKPWNRTASEFERAKW